jgi:hypothetical protein
MVLAAAGFANAQEAAPQPAQTQMTVDQAKQNIFSCEGQNVSVEIKLAADAKGHDFIVAYKGVPPIVSKVVSPLGQDNWDFDFIYNRDVDFTAYDSAGNGTYNLSFTKEYYGYGAMDLWCLSKEDQLDQILLTYTEQDARQLMQQFVYMRLVSRTMESQTLSCFVSETLGEVALERNLKQLAADLNGPTCAGSESKAKFEAAMIRLQGLLKEYTETISRVKFEDYKNTNNIF